MSGDPRRAIPRTDALLADPRISARRAQFAPEQLRAAVHAAQQAARDGAAPADHQALVDAALARLPGEGAASSLRPVLNATGVVVHTNLGRAPLPPAAVAALTTAAGYTDVEFDLATGRRARRGRGALEALRAAVPGAGGALVVNNGAAALALAAAALAGPDHPEVVVSRGELIEIGDGFRLPELLAAAGARLVEVGTTNRTTLADYRGALGERTGFVLKAHPSNFTVRGFTASVPVAELAALPAPVVYDIGSGLLRADPALPAEPDAASALAAGAALVTCSGDKLLGGPQAGLLLGRAELVERLRRHPLARALRVDKLTLAALEATLRAPLTPVAAALHADPDELARRAGAIAARLAGAGVPAEAVAHDGAVGGGGAPGLPLAGWAVAVAEELAGPLRAGEPPVVGRTSGGRLLLDPRAVPPADDEALVAAVLAAAGRAHGRG